MSGRLVILPKKTYCPWNPQNVERVLRDERLERERQHQQKKARQRAESQHRWDLLKQQQKDQSHASTSGQNYPNDEDNAQPKRFNLFEKEEQETVVVSSTCAPQNGPQKVGIMPVFLGESLDQMQAKKDAQEKKMHSQSYRQKQERRKYDMDPMKAFVEHPASIIAATSKGCDIYPNNATEDNVLPNGHVYWNPLLGGDEAASPQTPKKKRRKSKHTQRKQRRRRHASGNNSESESDDGVISSDDHQRKRKTRKHKRKHKHQRKPKRRHSSSSQKSSSSSSVASSKGELPPKLVGMNMDMDELRKRRLEREQREQLRARAVIQESMGLR